jgi:hypothetical protein
MPKEAAVHPSPPAPGERPCVDTGTSLRTAEQLFPPRDADEETRRRWLATSRWPEVVFAAAL